ncbi:MAG: dGTP triphosphohydrolase [Cytophagales bacterium]
MNHLDWLSNLSTVRWGFEERDKITTEAIRTDFHRDYDRIIFSSPFRRLQNKTQVFPLPGSVFVHNRLTHSLEVASVGRSLGSMVANKILKTKTFEKESSIIRELGTLVSVSCLAHDLGNPPFGHSGENAISEFFIKNESEFKSNVSQNEWLDFTHFEGNANTLRLLTHHFNRAKNSFSLTYSSMVSTVKYPCPVQLGRKKGNIHQKKYGYFQSEKQSFEKIAKETGLRTTGVEGCFFRHPLVFLVEAADDICYNVIDLEDAHRIGIISFEELENLLFPIILLGQPDKNERFKEIISSMEDENEKSAFLRSLAINQLVNVCSDVFFKNLEKISTGELSNSIFDELPEEWKNFLKEIYRISKEKIYNFPSSVQIEIAGYQVLGGLLEEFVPAVLKPEKTYNQKLLRLIPNQFKSNPEMSDYEKIFTI